MKRFFVTLLLVVGLTVPQALPDASGDSQSLTMTMLSRSKKADKKKSKNKKNKKKRQVGPAKKKWSGQAKHSEQNGVVPLIGTKNVTSGNNAPALCRVVVPTGISNRTVNYKAITVYFNQQLRIPNCVAYELTNTQVAMSDAPTAERRKNYQFATDNNVPGCPSHRDYSGSGYTRGHMAPAMDMRWDAQVMRECFYMTNMCPQIAKLNNDNWRVLEENIHRWAKRDGQLIVLTGPIVGNKHAAIGPKHDIAVPDAFYKIVYAPQHKRAIAFIYDNNERNGGMARHAVTIDEVERRTRLDFFTALGSDIERAIESQCDLNAWK